MAIRKTLTRTVNYYSDSNDVITKEKTYEKAYIEIVSVGGGKTSMEAVVVAFADETKENELFRTLHRFMPSVADGSQNIFRQAYEHIKTLPEYAGGEDC